MQQDACDLKLSTHQQ